MLAAYLQLLRRNRNYRLLWIAQIVSELGDWFYALAVYNLLLDLTGSKAQAVAFAVILQVLPSTFAAPTAGVLNDRISRKRIMIAADVARFFIVLGMLTVRTPSMVWLVYPLLFMETVAAAFFEPAHNAVIPNIVPESQVLAANALSPSPGASVSRPERRSAAWLPPGSGATQSSCSTHSPFSPPRVSSAAWIFCEPHSEGPPSAVRPRFIRLQARPGRLPLHPQRAATVRHRLRQGRHRTARREQCAAADSR